MPNIFQQIARTVQGKTKVGRILHQALPAKKLRSVVGEALLGLKKSSPLPETKDASVRQAVTEADRKLSEITGEGDTLAKAVKLKDTSGGELIDKIQEVRDILDDGKLNDSPDDLSPRAKTIIQQSFSALPLVAYLIYGISTGDFSLGGFLEYVKLFFGI